MHLLPDMISQNQLISILNNCFILFENLGSKNGTGSVDGPNDHFLKDIKVGRLFSALMTISICDTDNSRLFTILEVYLETY